MKLTAVDTLSQSQIQTLTEWFEALWWTPNRSLCDVEKMLKHSTIVAFEEESQGLVAFARILSDQVFKALILDVVVRPDLRKSGIGRTLMDAILQHHTLTEVRHFELYCAPEMKAMYEKWGFSDALGNLTFMRLSRK